MFLRQSAVGREPLAVTMSGVRLGERALQIGLNDPLIASVLAAKPGLSGHSAIVVPDEASGERAKSAVAKSGAFVEITVSPLEHLPFEEGSFDVAVIHNREGLLTTLGAAGSARILSESRRILRSGGRIIVLENGTASGFRALFRSGAAGAGQDAGDATIRGLEAAGFRAVRTLGDRDNYRFIEGTKVDLPK